MVERPAKAPLVLFLHDWLFHHVAEDRRAFNQASDGADKLFAPTQVAVERNGVWLLHGEHQPEARTE